MAAIYAVAKPLLVRVVPERRRDSEIDFENRFLSTVEIASLKAHGDARERTI